MRVNNNALLIAVVITVFCGVNSSSDKDGARGGTFSWSCNNARGLCEKSRYPIDETDLQEGHMSLKMCRLICGGYSSLWPKPTTVTITSKDLVAFHPSVITFESDVPDEKYLRHLDKIKHLFLDSCNRECAGCSKINDNKVNIRITSNIYNTDLYFGVDESYVLSVKVEGEKILIDIVSQTIYGARHALETLSQLIVSNRVSSLRSNDDVMLVILRQISIIDKPVYRHRGLLLDTARNYLPIWTIKRQIDGMAHSKMNVLHWHATDSQSFPLEMRSVSVLAKYGAYSDDQIYTEEDVTDLISYAKERGIRVILEIDAPAHAGNGWQWGPQADLGKLVVCYNKTPWRNYCIQPPCGQLNPANENLYPVLGQLYSDIARLFPKGEMFHMGGDEVYMPCWNASLDIISYLEKAGKGRTSDDFLWLWGQFQEKVQNLYDEATGKSRNDIILWSSALTEPQEIQKYLNKDRYIIQTWVGAEDKLPSQLLSLGYRLIVSTKNAWYLDHGFWGNTRYYPWRTVYKNRISSHKGVLGGEICMWGELVDDSTIDPRIWPRTAAAAERLWSDPDDSSAAAEPRFYQHRDRLVSRGIRAEALAPMWCVQNEGQCL